MTEEALWLDGNGLAGLLVEVFGADMTSIPHECQSCGRRNPVGAHRAYAGAGIVLRCPSCGAIAMRIVVLPDRDVVEVRGTWRLQIAHE